MALRTDTPIPTAGVTQELDPGDILEVQDLAEAIARAERMVAAPRSSSPADAQRASSASGPSLADMFEALGQKGDRAARPTDDTAGAATPAPPAGIPTPVPPRYIAMPSALPVLSTRSEEDDAYFQPAGRMRSLADVTLDGYRPEPTLLVRAAVRRKRFSWLLVAALLPLLALAGASVGAFASTGSSSTPRPVANTPAVPAAGKKPMTTTSATSKALTGVHTTPMTASDATPVFDVNSLPSARGKR